MHYVDLVAVNIECVVFTNIGGFNDVTLAPLDLRPRSDGQTQTQATTTNGVPPIAGKALFTILYLFNSVLNNFH